MMFFLKSLLLVNIPLILVILCLAGSCFAVGDPVLYHFQAGSPARADEVNSNFQELADRIDTLSQSTSGSGSTSPGSAYPEVSITSKLRKDHIYNDPTLVRVEFIKFDTDEVYLLEFPCIMNNPDVFSHGYCTAEVEEVLFEQEFTQNSTIYGYPAEVTPYSKSVHQFGQEPYVLQGYKISYNYGVTARIKVGNKTIVKLFINNTKSAYDSPYKTQETSINGVVTTYHKNLFDEDNVEMAPGDSYDYKDLDYISATVWNSPEYDDVQPLVIPYQASRQTLINAAIETLGWVRITKRDLTEN